MIAGKSKLIDHGPERTINTVLTANSLIEFLVRLRDRKDESKEMAVYFLILIILLCGSSNAQFLKSSIRMLQRNSDEKKRLRAAKRRQRLEKKRLKQLAREREKTEDDRQKKTSMTFNPSKIQEHQKEDDVFKNTVPVDETTTPSPISGKALSCSKTERHPKRFTIQLCNMSNLTAFDNAFVKAASRWESVITEKLPDIQRSTQDDFDLFAGQLGDRKVNIDVDDIVIGFDFRESSGVGSGGFLWMRSESFGGLPFSGRIILNSNVFKPESLDQQTATEYMLHELGHVSVDLIKVY